MLRDITQEEEYDFTDYGYRRKRCEDVFEVIAKCRNCGVLMTGQDEIITDMGDTFCSIECIEEFDKMLEDEAI